MIKQNDRGFEPVIRSRAFEQVGVQIRRMLASGALEPGDKRLS